MTTGCSEPAPAKSEEESKPATQVITGFLAESRPFSRGVKSSASACANYQELIETELSRGRNAMGIWQDLVDGHGFASSYQSVQRFVRSLRGASSPEARVIIETRAGEEAQVDYGTGPMVRDPETGKYRRTRLIRNDAWLQPKIGAAACLPIECPHLGRVAREGLSPTWRLSAHRRSG